MTDGHPLDFLRPVLAWARRHSLVAFPFVGALTGPAMAEWSDVRHLPLGVVPVAPSPRQADVLIVVGTLSNKMAPFLQRVHAHMSTPNFVLHIDDRSEATPLPPSYASVIHLPDILPVDVVLRGCPPTPAEVDLALARLEDRRRGSAA